LIFAHKLDVVKLDLNSGSDFVRSSTRRLWIQPGEPMKVTGRRTKEELEKDLRIDRNYRARLGVYIKAYNANRRQKGQHQGPLTLGIQRVLWAIVWFANGRGRCHPSYANIIDHIGRMNPDTISRALKVLRSAGLLSWTSKHEWREDLEKVVRAPNRYVLKDPLTSNTDNATVSQIGCPSSSLLQGPCHNLEEVIARGRAGNAAADLRRSAYGAGPAADVRLTARGRK
jgi:hypothetical protein